MTQEIEQSRHRYVWKIIQKLDVLHSELASLYRTDVQDARRIAAIWASIENLETELLVDGGVNYGDYAATASR